MISQNLWKSKNQGFSKIMESEIFPHLLILCKVNSLCLNKPQRFHYIEVGVSPTPPYLHNTYQFTSLVF